MFTRKLTIFVLATVAWLPTGQCLRAETIEGTVVIKRSLTRRRVTAAIPLYQRGSGVELVADAPEDPLGFERERVVIYLDGRQPAPVVVGTLTQEGRRFNADTVVIPAGSKVSFPNMDPIFHNVFSLSRAKSFDLGNYSQGETRVVTFTDPGVVVVNCHLHPNMAAVIFVTPNRWSAKADRDGHFTLRDVPPGRYTVVAWHKAAGYFRKEIEVGAGRAANVEFLIPWSEASSSTGSDALAAQSGK